MGIQSRLKAKELPGPGPGITEPDTLVSSLIVDRDRKYAPCRVTSRKKKVSPSIQEAGSKENNLALVYSDHYTLILKLMNLPKKRMEKAHECQWNLSKPGGWEKYQAMTAEI